MMKFIGNIRLIRVLTLILTVLPSATLYALQPINLNKEFDGELIGDKIEIFEDANMEWAGDELIKTDMSLQFKPHTDPIINFRYTTSVYWARFSVKNPTLKSLTWYLEIANPSIDSISLYVPDDMKNWTLRMTRGDMPFYMREFAYVNGIFAIPEKPGIRNYYIRFESKGSMNIPIKIWTGEFLSRKILTEYFVQGCYYILMMIIFLQGILTACKKPGAATILFPVIALAGICMTLSINGLGFQFIWPKITIFSGKQPHIISGSAFILSLFSLSLIMHHSGKGPIKESPLSAGMAFISATVCAAVFFLPSARQAYAAGGMFVIVSIAGAVSLVPYLKNSIALLLCIFSAYILSAAAGLYALAVLSGYMSYTIQTTVIIQAGLMISLLLLYQSLKNSPGKSGARR